MIGRLVQWSRCRLCLADASLHCFDFGGQHTHGDTHGDTHGNCAEEQGHEHGHEHEDVQEHGHEHGHEKEKEQREDGENQPVHRCCCGVFAWRRVSAYHELYMRTNSCGGVFACF